MLQGQLSFGVRPVHFHPLNYAGWAKAKKVPHYFCPYLRQLLADFRNSFAGTLCGQFATM